MASATGSGFPTVISNPIADRSIGISAWLRLQCSDSRMCGVAKKAIVEGSRRGLTWATAAFVAGVLLNVDRVSPWVPVAALIFVVWRLLAASRPLRLPGTVARSLMAFALVAAVVVRFHTLNGLS